MAHLPRGPEDAGAEHEREEELVALKQPPRNRTIHSLGSLFEEQGNSCRKPLVPGVQRIHNAVREKELATDVADDQNSQQ